VVYKWTDASGVVHFSDQPVPGAEKIVTAGTNTMKASSPPGAPPGVPGSARADSTPATQVFQITSPAPGQSFFGDELVAVRLDLSPPLRPGQTITWHLNGKELEEQGTTATQFTLPRLDRGTYAIAATITDQQTGESQSTASVSFFVRQPTELAPLRPRN